ncbi:MAG: ABC transporter substrate-binding protein [Alphaproteobacteria bacterium]|nr:ABC transporter substrate-binding protein [Alphaproteobacteria bacterium]
MRAIIAGLAAVLVATPILALADEKKDKDDKKRLSPEQEAIVVGARDYIQRMGDRTYAVLKAHPVGSSTRSTELAVLMIEAIDFPAIAGFSLGRRGRGMKGQSLQKYTRLFAVHFIDIATDTLKEADPNGFSITSAKLFPNNDVLVKTAISYETGDNFEAGWRVRRRGGGHKIVDVFVQGASAAQHFRNRFADWLGKAGVSGMITKLEGLTKDSPHLALVRNDLKLQTGG